MQIANTGTFLRFCDILSFISPNFSVTPAQYVRMVIPMLWSLWLYYIHKVGLTPIQNLSILQLKTALCGSSHAISLCRHDAISDSRGKKQMRERERWRKLKGKEKQNKAGRKEKQISKEQTEEEKGRNKHIKKSGRKEGTKGKEGKKEEIKRNERK